VSTVSLPFALICAQSLEKAAWFSRELQETIKKASTGKMYRLFIIFLHISQSLRKEFQLVTLLQHYESEPHKHLEVYLNESSTLKNSEFIIVISFLFISLHP
jgi:hypothetical protein